MCPPALSIPAHGKALNWDDPNPFHPKPFCGEDPVTLDDPCRICELLAGFCPGGCLGTQLEARWAAQQLRGNDQAVPMNPVLVPVFKALSEPVASH